jgi:hypothetical protein
MPFLPLHVHRSLIPLQMFVSINYRVAAGGFLNSKEIMASGNQNIGLYDQVRAFSKALAA